VLKNVLLAIVNTQLVINTRACITSVAFEKFNIPGCLFMCILYGIKFLKNISQVFNLGNDVFLKRNLDNGHK